MPNLTTNLGLKKPLESEFYDVNVMNENLDTIDLNIEQNKTDFELHNHDNLYPKFLGSIPLSGSINDLNLATKTGWYTLNIDSCVIGNNMPSRFIGYGAYGILQVQNRYELSTVDANWVHQRIILGTNVWERFKTNGVWVAWQLVIMSDGTDIKCTGMSNNLTVTDMTISNPIGRIITESKGKSIVFDGDAATSEFRASTLSDNAINNGSATARWKQFFAGTTTISTSDRNYKQQISTIEANVLDAWAEVNYCKFKFNDAVAEKGTEARWHVGVIAQDIEEAFARHSLDAFDYGLLCFDEWEDIYEDQVKDDGTIVKVLVKPKGQIYSIRPTECQFLEMALQRRETEKLKEQLQSLQG